jgi:hypothetical protein
MRFGAVWVGSEWARTVARTPTPTLPRMRGREPSAQRWPMGPTKSILPSGTPAWRSSA